MKLNQRKAPRLQKRMKVEFGRDELSWPGFTHDFSTGGMLLQTQHLEPVGTRLHLRVHLPDSVFLAEGVVVRHKAIPRELRTIERPAMGIRFLTPQEVLDEAMKGRGTGALVVECADPPRAREFQESLDTGYVLAPAAPTALPAVNTVVALKVHLGFKPDAHVEAKGRVVQILDADGTSKSVVLEVQDLAVVRNAVRRALAA